MASPEASDSVRHLPRSGIRRVFDEASKYSDCIRLEVGEPSFTTPQHIKDAAHLALNSDFTKYTPNAGIAELREGISQKLRDRNNIIVATEQIVITPGGVASVFSSLTALLNKGDEVLLADPSWPNYLQMTILLGAVPVFYPLRIENDLVPTASDIESKITSKTKVLLLNSPGNPSGAIIPENELRAILAVAKKYNLWVISDEVYDEIYFEKPPMSLQPLDNDGRVISVFSFSKTYAMTGWRVGYLTGPISIVSHILRAQEPITSCVNSVAQKAAFAAITGDQKCVAEMRHAYAKRALLVTKLLTDNKVQFARPTGAFYTMVDITASGMPDLSFVSRMITEKRVSVVPGSAFGPGSGNFVRVSLASSESDLDQGVSRLATAIKEWGS